jgi:hypothetical protein
MSKKQPAPPRSPAPPDPDDPVFLMTAGFIADRAGRTGQAARCDREALDSDPEQPVPRPGHLPLRLAPGLQPRHTERHGHCLHLRALWQEPEDDHAVAVSDYGDTPDKISNLRMSGQPRLNGKLRAPDRRTGQGNRYASDQPSRVITQPPAERPVSPVPGRLKLPVQLGC